MEEEEEKLQDEGYYDSDESVEEAEDADIRMKADLIREKRAMMRNEARMRKSLKNRAAIPRSAKAKKLSQMERALDSAGYDVDAASARARSQSQPRGRSTARNDMEDHDDDAMDVDTSDPRQAIAKAKASNANKVEISQTQIAFSRDGLTFLGHSEALQDTHFDNGPMRKEMKQLGDGGPWYEPFKSTTIHGVFSIAASRMFPSFLQSSSLIPPWH